MLRLLELNSARDGAEDWRRQILACRALAMDNELFGLSRLEAAKL